MAAETIIQLRRGSAAAWASQNPVLSAGEFGLETDTFKMKMGNGSTAWESLDYVVKQIDNLLLDNNTISSVNENGNIVLDPNGEGVVDVSNARVTNVGTPVGANDAANKAYVDATKQGLDVKESVRAATTGNVTLSGTQTVDGVVLSADQRVLVKNQGTASENGIYLVKSGAWERSADANVDAEVTPGMFVFVEEGTVNADSGWVLTTDAPISLGSTGLAFTQFSGAGQVSAGAGMTKTGNTLDVVGTADRILVNADSVDIASTYAGQTSITTLGTVGTGVWQGSEVEIAYGGTGATNAADARSNLGVAIGSDVQAHSSTLDNLAAGTYTGATSITTLGTVSTGVWQGSEVEIAYGGTGATNAADARSNLGVAIGSDVQAYSATLAAVAGGTYAGATSITTLGTVSTGTWQGSTVAVAYGGTGATNAADARANLGLVIGTNVQAYDAELAALAGTTSAADALPYFTGLGTATTTTLTSFGRSLIDDASSGDARTTLGLVIGTDVQAYNSTLAAVAGGTYVGATSITTLGTVGTGVWQGSEVEIAYGGTGATNASDARSNLGLAIGSDVQAYNSTLAAVAGGTYVGATSITTLGTVSTGTWQGTQVGAVYGGTGMTSYTAGDIIYASATNTLSKLAKGSGKYFLKMDSAGNFPEWSNSLDGGTP